ncbi:MAG: flagellar basal body rod protein FlgC [Polyangia bacterium]
MDFLTALHVSGSGLSAERTRVNLASSNLANAETTRGPNGKPYQRLDPVFEAIHMAGQNEAPTVGQAPLGVEVSQIVADQTPGKMVYSPDHPDADADGFVTLPNVNPIAEIVNLLSASRAFEANATAIETLKQMASRGLDIAK